MVDVIEIDKGIPIPPKGGGGSHLPFGRMEIGDSFAIPCEGPRTRNQINCAAISFGKRHGKTFVARTRVELDQKIIRIWRTA